jgi:nicotinamide riboside kinase
MVMMKRRCFAAVMIAARIIIAASGGPETSGTAGRTTRIKVMKVDFLVEAVFSSEKMDVRKVGVMGAHGTGKTTMARAAAKEMMNYYPRTALVQEQARECPYSINRNMSMISQRWLFGRQIVSEHVAARDAEILVCDRTILDSIVYSTWLEEHGRNEITPFLNAVMPFALQYMESYSGLVWCRPNGSPPADDGFRDTDPDFQHEIDAIFERFVIGYGLPVLVTQKEMTV